MQMNKKAQVKLAKMCLENIFQPLFKNLRFQNFSLKNGVSIWGWRCFKNIHQSPTNWLCLFLNFNFYSQTSVLLFQFVSFCETSHFDFCI